MDGTDLDRVTQRQCINQLEVRNQKPWQLPTKQGLRRAVRYRKNPLYLLSKNSIVLQHQTIIDLARQANISRIPFSEIWQAPSLQAMLCVESTTPSQVILPWIAKVKGPIPSPIDDTASFYRILIPSDLVKGEIASHSLHKRLTADPVRSSTGKEIMFQP